MNLIIGKWKSFSPYFLGFLRIVAAIMFMTAGTMKLFGYPISMPGGIKANFPSEIWFAGVLETYGGFLLMIGLCTRCVAFVLSGEMAVAFFQAHFPHHLTNFANYLPIVNHGTDAVFYCFLFLYFSAAGAGKISIDHYLINRKRIKET